MRKFSIYLFIIFIAMIIYGLLGFNSIGYPVKTEFLLINLINMVRYATFFIIGVLGIVLNSILFVLVNKVDK